jgi:hypothetical protein
MLEQLQFPGPEQSRVQEVHHVPRIGRGLRHEVPGEGVAGTGRRP